MTNPTLERAARALAALDEKSYRRLNMYGVHSERYLAKARAVLMAVLPELQRYDPYEHHGSYDENQTDDGLWVKYDDLTAILEEGE